MGGKSISGPITGRRKYIAQLSGALSVFLVDEFQDTNGSQNEILNLLISYWDVPNVFAVGMMTKVFMNFKVPELKISLTFIIPIVRQLMWLY